MHTLTAPNPDSPKNSVQCIPKKAVTFIRPQSTAPASSVPLTIQIPPRIVRSSSTSSEVDVTTADSWSEVTSSVEPNEDEDAFDQLIGPEQNVSLSSLSKLVRMNSSTIRRYPDQLHLIATPMEIQNPDQPDQSACVIHIYNRLEDVDHTRRSVEKLSVNRSPNRTSPNQSRARQHHTSPVPISSTTINLAHSSDQIQHISSNNPHRNRSQCTVSQHAPTDTLDNRSRLQARHRIYEENLHRLEQIYANEQMRPIAKSQVQTRQTKPSPSSPIQRLQQQQQQQQKKEPSPLTGQASNKTSPMYRLDGSVFSETDKLTINSPKTHRVLCVSTQFDHVPHNLTVFRSPDEPGRAHIVPGCPALTYLDSAEDPDEMFAEQRPTTEERMNSRKAEQERVQKKTFTNWLNTYLCNSELPMKINDLFVDIKDGVALIRILELLSKQKLHTEVRGQMQRVHCLANIKTALEFLESKNVKLVNINATDIADGKPAIVLGLIWSIILYFQIEEQEEILLEILGLPAGSGRSRGSAKHILKQWVQEIFNGKYEVKVNDFGPSWRDGIAFNAMVHNIDSRLVRMEDLKQRSHRENLEHAFSQAEAHLGIPRLLDPEDVDVDRPDEKSIMTYVAQFFKAYPDGGKRKTVEEAPDSTSLIDESANARELIAAIRKTEAEVSTEMNRKNVSLSEQFQKYLQNMEHVQHNTKWLQKLEADWEQASTNNSNTSSDLEIATEALASLRDTLDTWRWKLDSMVPGDLGKIARWICQAEQWLKATSRSWYQSVTGSKLIAVTGRHDESWRPSSADPPNSPPSSLKVMQLIEEKKEVFGLNNTRATTMRDLLSSTQTQTDSQLEFVPKFLVEQLGKRIADVIGREPGCTAVLEAARARRKFLDLLYAHNIVETEKGVTIRNRRKTSTVGLEHRLVDWTVAVDGLQSSENKQTIEQMLIDYENCTQSENVPEQLDQSKTDVAKQYALLEQLAHLDECLLPKNSLKVVGSWKRDCEHKWNADKISRLDAIGIGLKRRLDMWNKFNMLVDKVERSLSQAERLVASEVQPPEGQEDLAQWIKEAQAVALQLGASGDHELIQSLKKRLAGLNEQVGNLKAAEANKLENARREEQAQAEFELVQYLDKVEEWTSTVDRFLNPASKQGTEEERIMCTSRELDKLMDRLNELITMQSKAQENLQIAIRIANSPPLQPGESKSQARLSHVEVQMEHLYPTLTSQVANLKDLVEKTQHIESGLAQIERAVKQVEVWHGKLFSSVSPEGVANNSNIFAEFAELRGHLAAVSAELDELERSLHSERNWPLTSAFGLTVCDLRSQLCALQDLSMNHESKVKNQLALLDECEDSIIEAFASLKENGNSLAKLKEATIKASRAEVPRLVRLLEGLRAKYTTSVANSVNTGVAKAEQLFQVPPDNKGVQVSAPMKARLQQRLAELNDGFKQQGEEIGVIETKFHAIMQSIKVADERGQKVNDWLVTQERLLANLSSGPSPGTDSEPEQVDNVATRVQAQVEWQKDCQNYLNDLQSGFDIFLGIDEDQQTYPDEDALGENGESLRKRYERLENEARNVLTEATAQYSCLEELQSGLVEANQWLVQTEKNYVQMHTANKLSNSGNAHDLRQSYQHALIRMDEELRTGHLYVDKCKEAIQQLIEVTHRHNTTAVVMIARRELSQFQASLGKLQRQVETEQNNVESKLNKRTKFMNDLSANDHWVKEVESQLSQRTDAGEQNSLQEIVTQKQTEVHRLNRLIHQLELRDAQWQYQSVIAEDMANDMELQDRLEAWRSQLHALLDRARQNLAEHTTRMSELQECQCTVDSLRTQVNEIERQRNMLISSLDNSLDDGKDGMREMQERLVASKDKIKLLLSKKDEIYLQMDEMTAVSCEIQNAPAELIHLKEEADKIFQNLDIDFSRLEAHISATKELDVLMIRFNQQLNNTEAQSNELLTRLPVLNEGCELADALTFYQQRSRDLRDMISHLECTIDTLQTEIESHLTRSVCLEGFLETDSIRLLKSRVRSQVEQLQSKLYDHQTRRDKLVSDLKSSLACEREAKAYMESLEGEVNDLRQVTRAESIEVSSKAVRDMLSRIKSEGSVTRDTLNKSIQTTIQTMRADQIQKDAVQFGRLVESIRMIPTRFDRQLSEVQHSLEQLLTDYQDLAKAEGYHLNQATDIRHELDLVGSLTNSCRAKLNEMFNENDFHEIGQQIEQLMNKLDAQKKRLAKIQHDVTSQNTVSNELKATLSQLEKLYTDVRADLNDCDCLRDSRSKAANQYRQAIHRCECALSTLERQIDVVCKPTDIQLERQSPTTLVDQLIDQLETAKRLLVKQPASSRCEETTVTELSSAIDNLVQSAADLNLSIRGSEWTRFLMDIDRYLSRLTTERERLIRAASLKQSFYTRLSNVESRLMEMEKVLQNEIQASAVNPVFTNPVQAELKEISSELQKLDELTPQLHSILPEEQRLILDRLSQTHVTHKHLLQLCSQLHENLQAKAIEEEQLNATVVDVLKQIVSFKENLTELEAQMPVIGESNSESNSPLVKLRQWFTTNLPRVQKLEHEREEIEQKLGKLQSRLIDNKSTHSAELEAGLDQIKPERVRRLQTEMTRHKSNLDQYELMLAQLAQTVIEFEVRRDRLRDNNSQLNPTEMEEWVQTTLHLEEQKWKALLEEIDHFKVERLPELANLETQLPIRLPRSMSHELQERLHVLCAEVGKQVEQNKRANTFRNRLSTVLKSFHEAVIKARTDYGRILQTLVPRLNELDGTSRPTEICESLQKHLDSAAKRGVAFRTDALRRLNEIWQQVVSEAKQIEAGDMIKDTTTYAAFLDLQTEFDHIHAEIQTLNIQIKQLRQQWIESDQRFEAQKLSEPNEFVADHVTGMSSISPIWSLTGSINGTGVPSENEVTNEAKQNLARLQLQMTTYQKKTQHLEVKYKTLVEQKAENEELTNQLFDVLQCVNSLANHDFGRFNQTDYDKQVPQEATCRVFNELRARYQTLQNEMNEAIHLEQTRMAHLSRLIQSVIDLDTWHLEFYALLSGWFTVRDKNVVKAGAEMTQLKFSVAQGQACYQSIEDWSKQLAEADSSKAVAALTRAQISRANQIVCFASSRPEQFQADLETRDHNTRQINQGISQQMENLAAWQQKFKQLKSDSIKLVAIASQDYDGLRQIGTQLSECLDNLEEQCTELRANRARFNQKKEDWRPTDPSQNIQIDDLEKKFDTCQKTADELIRSLEQVRMRFVDVNTFIQRSRQWLHEVSEQIPKARETRSPVRLPPHPLDIGIGGSAAQHKMAQMQARSRSPSQSRTPPGRNGMVEQNCGTPTTITRLRRTLHQDRLDWLNQLVTDLNSAGSRLIQEAQTRAGRLESELNPFRLEVSSVHEENGRIREEFEQVLSYASYMRQEVAETLDALNQFEQGAESWRKWYDGVRSQLRSVVKSSLIGYTGIEQGERNLMSTDYPTMDLTSPIADTIQRYQKLTNQIANGRAELTRLEALSTDLLERCNEASAQQRFAQLQSLHDTLVDSCRDILPKLQTVANDEREFYRDLTELENVLKEKNAQLETAPTERAKWNQLEEQNQRTKSTIIELERLQPKLFSLSDKADRVCHATSVVALAMHNLLLIDPIPSADGSFLASSLDSSLHGGVGSKSKRALTEFRERWKSTSQRLEQLIDQSTEAITQQNRLNHIQENLAKWLDSIERRLDRLHHEVPGKGHQITNDPKADSPTTTRHLGTWSHGALWSQHVESFKNLLCEAEQMDAEADELRRGNAENFPDTLARSVKELTERVANMRTRIQKRVSWLRDVDDLINLFRHEAQETERWMTSVNFRLNTPSNQQTGIKEALSLTGNLPASSSEGVKFTAHEVLVKEIETDGTKLVTGVHNLAHELIHAALNETASGTEGYRYSALGACEVAGCDLRETPFNQQTMSTLQYLVQPNARPLGMIALDSVQRTKELETNHANLYATALALQNRIQEHRSRWKAYVGLLHSIALTLIMDLPHWWSKQYGDQPRSGTGIGNSTTPGTTNVNTNSPFQFRASLNRTDYSIPYLSGQLEHLALTATDKIPAPKTNNLTEVDQLLEDTSIMETQMNNYRKEMASYGRDAIHLTGLDDVVDPRTSLGSPTPMEQMPVDQLCQRVNATIERESRKLGIWASKLQELRAEWHRYTTDRDLFRRWLTDRQAAAQHLLELRSRATDPQSDENRALEDFLSTLRQKEHQLTGLLQQHAQLVAHNPQVTDSQLDSIKSDYYCLLTRTEARIRKAQLRRGSVDFEVSHKPRSDRQGVPLSRIDALIQQSAKTVHHTKVLNQLARSVRKLNEELTGVELDDFQSRLQYLGLIDQSSRNRSGQSNRTERGSRTRPSSTESVRRNLPRRIESDVGLDATKHYYHLRTSMSVLPLDTGRLTDSGQLPDSGRARHHSTNQKYPLSSAEPQISQSWNFRMRQSALDGLHRPRSASSQPQHSRLTQSHNTGFDMIQQIPDRERPQTIGSATTIHPTGNGVLTKTTAATAATRQSSLESTPANGYRVPPSTHITTTAATSTNTNIGVTSLLPTQQPTRMLMMNSLNKGILSSCSSGYDRTRPTTQDVSRTRPSPSLIPVRKALVGRHGLACVSDYVIRRPSEITPWKP